MSGAKYDQGKAPWHLFPFDAAGEVVEVLRLGAEKYGDRNWEKGIKLSRLFAALMRHLLSWWLGEDRDKESGLPHLAHVACNALMLLALRSRAEWDDRGSVKDKPVLLMAFSTEEDDLGEEETTVVHEALRQPYLPPAKGSFWWDKVVRRGCDQDGEECGWDYSWGCHLCPVARNKFEEEEESADGQGR